MKRMTKTFRFSALSLAIGLCASAAWAQQKDPRVPPLAPQAPLSGGESSSRSGADPSANPPASQSEKAPPLTSAEGWRLGGSTPRNYFVPSLGFSQGGDTNPGNRVSDRGVQSASSVSGNLVFHRLAGRGEFTGTYSGGATFYSGAGQMNNWYQKMELSQKVSGRRWTLLFGDSVDYRQDPYGGFSSSGGLPGGVGSATGGSAVDPVLLPSQTISTGPIPRISNTAYGELQRAAGRRSSFTFTGSYGLVRYLEQGLNDSNNANFGAGYNYAVTGRDSLALSYGANLYRFPGFNQKNNSHSVHLSYRRLLSGRLAFDLGAGPQVTLVDGSVTGSSKVISWSLKSVLRYRMQRSSLSLSYNHSATGGSGFFLGAETDNVGAAWTHPLSRLWTATWDFGYAHNRPIGSDASGASVYDTWRGGFRVGRPLGRYGQMFFNYNAEHQETNGPACTGPACGFLGTRHVFGIGFNFRFKPVDID